MRRLLLLAALVALPASAYGAGRNVAILIDTSGSMLSSDRPRYTVQIAQIVADLLDGTDVLSVIRLPPGETCEAGPNPALQIRRNAGDAAGFKVALNGLITYGGNNHFAGPVRTAIDTLTFDPKRPRMLLMIADSGGLDACDAVLTRDLLRLRESGALVAAINLGSSAGAFDRNAAFSFTTAAQNSHELIEAVARVYQKFLGARQAQTGRVADRIEIDIHPHVREAFLVVAADGPIGPLRAGTGNPGARAVDPDHRGGGETLGLDNRRRGYRIVRLQRPAAGRWTFTAPGLGGTTAGWLLLQEHALAARLVSALSVPAGIPTPLEVEVVDADTGHRITDLASLRGLDLSAEIDGVRVALRDDGTGGDRRAGDGILGGTHTFARSGQTAVRANLRTDTIERQFVFVADVVEVSAVLHPPPLTRLEAGRVVEITVRVEPVAGRPMTTYRPERIDVDGAPEGRLALRDNGEDGDRQAGDGVYTARWTPLRSGSFTLTYTPVGGVRIQPVKGPVEVLGRIEFGPIGPLGFGRLGGRSQGNAVLDLSSSQVYGTVDLKVSAGRRHSGAALEMSTPEGWRRVDAGSVPLRVDAGGTRAWPLRLRVGDCPGAATEGNEVALEAIRADGTVNRVVVPATFELIPDPWLHCWWRTLVLIALGIVTAVVIHGYVSPSRFARGLGVHISQMEDMAEGFTHPVRATRGSGSGFYRDARVFLASDYRLTGRPMNAAARLRADRGGQVRLTPMGGTLWRQTMDGVWEEHPADERPMRPGAVYRNDAKTLYFELRRR